MLSIITSTFNRAYTLNKLYESLNKQSSKDFEWIIIDDGSTDNTKVLIEEWTLKENIFEIRYFYQINGGKHRAINNGVSKAKYDYCFFVDSDDYIVETAVEKIHTWIEETKENELFAGVSGLKGYANGCLVGEYPKNTKYKRYIDASNLERKKRKLSGDKAEVYRTDILKEYKFPEFLGENFLTEEVVWDAIARDGYILRWYNDIIYKCEYIEDGLTRMGERKVINNFEGYTYSTKQRMKLHGFLAKQFAIGLYLNVASKKGLNLKESANKLEINILEAIFAYIIWLAKNCIKYLIKIYNKRFSRIGDANEYS